jgi:hypothetical protein
MNIFSTTLKAPIADSTPDCSGLMAQQLNVLASLYVDPLCLPDVVSNLLHPAPFFASIGLMLLLSLDRALVMKYDSKCIIIASLIACHHRLYFGSASSFSADRLNAKFVAGSCVRDPMECNSELYFM